MKEIMKNIATKVDKLIEIVIVSTLKIVFTCIMIAILLVIVWLCLLLIEWLIINGLKGIFEIIGNILKAIWCGVKGC